MKKYITKQSSIKGAGKGLFTNASFKKDEVIGLAHVDGQPHSEIGHNHNHNEKNPTAYSKKIDNKRYIYALKDLKPGEEITTNYRMQPELEQPEDFMREGGGTRSDIPVIEDAGSYNKEGFWIPNWESMKAQAKELNAKTVKTKHGSMIYFDDNWNVQSVDDNPQMKRGGYTRGLIPMPKASKKGLASKTYSRSLEATNRLFALNPFFEVPKSRKRKIFDPNASFYDKGGALLTKKVTCKKCGWTWDAEDGGNDITTCHKCGGQGLVHAQDGGDTDAMNGMMKARLAYANEFGNPAAQRMINLPDNPYQFENGDTGTHYMASMDNYAVPQIQDENGQLMLGDYGPESNEAMRFDSDEDANYFAEHYKDVSPGFIEAELTDDEIQTYRDGGYIVEEVGNYQEGGATAPIETQVQPIPPIAAPEIMPTGDLVAPPVIEQPVQPVQQPVQPEIPVVSTPPPIQIIPTKKEVDKVAMPKIEASGNTLAIQKKLVAAGYNIGSSGPSGDGVDGVMGNRTKMALDAFNSGIPASKLKTPVSNTTPKKNQVVNKNLKAGYLPYLDKGEEVCVKGKGCSSNVSIKMANLVGGFAEGDIWANDAWFNKSDVLNKGGDLIYETSERDVSKMPKVPKDVYSKLQVGDYVQLNRPNTNTSNKFAAEKKGGLENENIEHLGFVVGKDKDGTPLIWHGSETGKAFIQRLDAPITLNDHDKSTFTYQVASIVRSPALKNADLSGLQNTAYYSTIDPKQKLIPGKTATERQKQAATVINDNVKNIKNLGYSQEDANFVGQILVGGIMLNETSGGESLKRVPKEIAATVWKNILGQGNFEGDEASTGYYQMKPTLNFVNKDGTLNSLGKKLEKLGVDPKDIGTFDIGAQTKAGTIILLDNYDRLKQDPDFNVKTGLYKGKVPASYILAKSWQAGVDWQSRDKYKTFLNNLDVDYSDKALLNAINSMSIAGSKKTVNSEYAKVKAYQNQINAKKLAAEKKIKDEKIIKHRIQQASIDKGKQDSRKIGYAESTAIRNVPTGKGLPDLRKLNLAKKPATKTFWDQMTDTYAAAKKAAAAAKKSVAKKPVAKKVVAKKPVAKKPVAKATPLAQYLKSLNNPLFKKTSLFAEGGIVTELSPKEIEDYKKAGYIIEEVD